MDTNNTEDHAPQVSDSSEEPASSGQEGASSYGWIWVVGIVILVAVVLFFLQGRVPEVKAPTQDEAAQPADDSTAADAELELNLERE